jgi:hypothetical protein
MRETAVLYAELVSLLSEILPTDIITSSQKGYSFEAWTKETRMKLSSALTACKELEQKAMENIADAFNHWGQ